MAALGAALGVERWAWQHTTLMVSVIVNSSDVYFLHECACVCAAYFVALPLYRMYLLCSAL